MAVPFCTGAVKEGDRLIIQRVFSVGEMYKLVEAGAESVQVDLRPFFTGSLEGLPWFKGISFLL